MLAANHVERISDGEDVGAALEGGKSTIAQSPVTAVQRNRGQAAADTKLSGLCQSSGGIGAPAVYVSSRNSTSNSGCLAGAVTLRLDHIENAVVPSGELVNVVFGKNVGFRDCDIAPVVTDVLIAGESAWLSKSRRPSRNEIYGLVIAEAGKQSILAGKIVVEPHVELFFIQLPHGHTRKIEPSSRSSCARKKSSRIKTHQSLTHRVLETR